MNNNFCHPACSYSKLWKLDSIMPLQQTFYNRQLIEVCHISSYGGSWMTKKIQLGKQNTIIPHISRFPSWGTQQTTLKTWTIQVSESKIFKKYWNNVTRQFTILHNKKQQSTNFPNSRSHLQILGVIRAIWGKLQIDKSQFWSDLWIMLSSGAFSSVHTSWYAFCV